MLCYVVVILCYIVLNKGVGVDMFLKRVLKRMCCPQGRSNMRMEKIKNENIVIYIVNRYLEDCQMKLN